jgi:hypothetical protein
VQKLTSAWVPVSVIIAVVLWFLATTLENRLRAPEPAPSPGGVSENERAERPPPETDAAGAMSCEASESRLKGIIDNSRMCTSDDDCTLFDYGYPMDCMTSVATSQVPLLREEYEKYGAACEFRVFYDCPTEPYVRLALCRNNRCVVELDRLDSPEDFTQEQLERRRPN